MINRNNGQDWQKGQLAIYAGRGGRRLEKISWVDERYEKHYENARWILTAGVTVLSILAFWYEDLVLAMREVVCFAVATWLFSYPMSSFSMKMINYADKREKNWKKVLFYLTTLVVAFVLCIIAIKVLLEIWARGGNYYVVTEGLGDISFYLTAWIILSIALFLPWLQSILVLIMRKWFLKNQA